MLIPLGAGSSEYWLLPGNKKLGYCRLNVTISASSPHSAKAKQSRSLKMEIPPPRKGWAEPIITTFNVKITSLFSFQSNTYFLLENFWKLIHLKIPQEKAWFLKPLWLKQCKS